MQFFAGQWEALQKAYCKEQAKEKQAACTARLC